MDIFLKAKEAPSFDYWLENLPAEDLQYLCNITDDVDAGKLQDQDSFDQLVALVIYFSGRDEMSQDEALDAFQSLAIVMSAEINVRQGKMIKTGTYSLLKNEDSAKFSLTDKGRKEVKSMFGKTEQQQ